MDDKKARSYDRALLKIRALMYQEPPVVGPVTSEQEDVNAMLAFIAERTRKIREILRETLGD